MLVRNSDVLFILPAVQSLPLVSSSVLHHCLHHLRGLHFPHTASHTTIRNLIIHCKTSHSFAGFICHGDAVLEPRSLGIRRHVLLYHFGQDGAGMVAGACG